MPEDRYFRPTNWGVHQKVKRPNADHIRLKTSILNDEKILALTPAQRWIWVGLLVLCGVLGRPLPLSSSFLGARLGVPSQELGRCMKVLERCNLIEICLKTDLLDSKKTAETETETETERITLLSNASRVDEKKLKAKGRREKAREYDQEFLAWWGAYPRREQKGDAFDVYWTMRDGGHSAEVLQAGAEYAAEKYSDKELEWIPLPATFLRREQFLDIENGGDGADPPAHFTPEEKLDWWKRRITEDERDGDNDQRTDIVCGEDDEPRELRVNGRAESGQREGLQAVELSARRLFDRK